MTQYSDPVQSRRAVLPWVVVALAVILAVGGFVWMNYKIEALQQAAAPQQASGEEDVRQATAALGQTVKEVQAGQQKLAEELADIQRKLAAESGERKLLSEQVGALSSRVDSLASANAASTAPAPQAPKNRRAKQ
ncbi:hypothetical protein AB8Z38_11310 [Bradyrhizobium sp. LLZ17]|uniref:Kinesin n=2 Tax=unclassified Bradyrhizobium TaxID=2631580 RepID=A0AB39XT65_9BRAD